MNPTTTHSSRLPPTAGEFLDVSFSQDLLASVSRDFEQFGDAYRAYSPITGRDIYVLSHPEHARHVLVSHQTNFTKGLGIERVEILLGNGLMVSEGDLWRTQRRMIQPAFHRSAISRMLGDMREANLQLLHKWFECAEKKEDINLTQDMSEVTLQIVLRALFSADLERMTAKHGTNPFGLLTDDTERNLSFAYRFRSLSKMILEQVQLRRSNPGERTDLIAMLMKSRDRKSGEPMSDKQLLDEVMTLIVAGHETTASALNWMWYLISQHPLVAARLHAEVDAVSAGELTLEDLSKLPYTKQVIEETLRLYPPGWLLTRRSIERDSIGDFEIPAGTDIFISPYLIHRHPKFWSAPDRFDPDRFAAPEKASRHRFAYLPFALGPRACIGEQFALAEMIVHAAMLAKHVKLVHLPLEAPELECQVNLRSRYPIMMKPEMRATLR